MRSRLLGLTKMGSQKESRHRAVLEHVPVRLLVALTFAVVALLVVSVGVARAEAPRLVFDGRFESVGALGVAVTNSVKRQVTWRRVCG